MKKELLYRFDVRTMFMAICHTEKMVINGRNSWQFKGFGCFLLGWSYPDACRITIGDFIVQMDQSDMLALHRRCDEVLGNLFDYN